MKTIIINKSRGCYSTKLHKLNLILHKPCDCGCLYIYDYFIC